MLYCESSWELLFWNHDARELYLVLDDLSKSQVEIHLTFAKQFKVTAAAAGLSFTLDPVG